MSHVPVAGQPWRIALTLAVFAGLFAYVGTRLHHLQVHQAVNLSAMNSRQHTRTWVLPAARGNLYDAAGAPLVVSESTWALIADPLYMDDRLRATVEINRILGIPRDELRAHFESPRNGRVIARGIRDPEPGETSKPDALRALLTGRNAILGLYLQRECTRAYKERVAPHVLGFVQADGTGGAGIEQTLDERLAGIPGRETMAIDARGRPILTGQDRTEPRPGAHVQLTIDLAIQRQVEESLAEAVGKFAPKGAAAIVVRPATGEVLAMASWPTFDPVDRSRLDPATLRNNAIAFVYEPGSTMKPLIAGAAAAEGLAGWTQKFDCGNGAWTYRLGRSARTIHEKSGGHGVLTMIEGIAFSDNIMMAKLGILLGPERLRAWVDRLHFGQRTGICLSGDDAGILPPKRAWNPLDACMSVPMGHAIAVTPIQMTMAHAAIANGGMLLPPRLVKRVYAQDGDAPGRELDPPTLPEPSRIYSAEDALQIQDAMNRTMEDGTGKRSALDGYSSAGKTGTAEKLINGRYSNEHNVGSFVCWAPAEPGMRAELLCLVVIDDPSKGGRFGSEVAAPTVQRILQSGLEYLRVPKREGARTVAIPGDRRARVRQP